MKKNEQVLPLIVFLAVYLTFYVYSDQDEFRRVENNVNTLCEIMASDTVSDKQIQDTINNLVFHDKNEKKTVSLDYMSKMTKILKNRPLVASWLHLYSGRLNRNLNNEKIALDHFAASSNLLDSLYAEVTVQRQETLLELGSSYYRLGDKENADKVFLEAQSYPYATFTIRNLDIFRRLENVYRRAVLGLIMTRAGNAKKLREIVVIPAANDLRPKIEKAIKQAEGKSDE
jgi:hypothetical protein